ncbi:hypothetical protein ACIQ9I_05790 [Streptomyces sp. NPDC094461]|uniref:hypothetical protein n=1 Tax=unclassified Streptomyces TaxID=2593676 RepID=UPI002E795796|nr:hypothetical protein [Streptomyces sp. JV190]MEE1844001.1 hypothetical protein [Streptomyces sp. JV190]
MRAPSARCLRAFVPTYDRARARTTAPASLRRYALVTAWRALPDRGVAASPRFVAWGSAVELCCGALLRSE